jgi:plasmid stabilization system protein ParE
MSDLPSIDVRPRALEDSFDCAMSISKDSPAAGLRFLEAFDATIREIADFPESGAVVEVEAHDLRNCRSWPVRGFSNWRIYYRISPGLIQVSRVLHTARDLGTID